MNISQTFIETAYRDQPADGGHRPFSARWRTARWPVSDLPNVDLPTLLVTASLPGASPETMAAAVATPLENQFSMIAGLNSMTSSNSLGNTQITLEFDLNRKLDGAAVDVQAAITQSSRMLPQGMPTPADVHQGEPGRSADALPCADFADAAAVDARRVRRDAHRAAHFDDFGRGAGAGAGRAEVCGPRADGPARHGGAPDRHQRNRNCAQELERKPADRAPSSGRSARSRCRPAAS